MKIELLNGFTRVNPTDTQNTFNLEGRDQRRKRKLRRQRRRNTSQLNPQSKARSQARSVKQSIRQSQPSLVTKSRNPSKQEILAIRSERNRRGNTRRNSQQMLIDGYDANVTLKDNAIYSDSELLQFPGAGLLASKLLKGGKKKKSKGIPRAKGELSRADQRRKRKGDRKALRRLEKQKRVDDRQDSRRTKRTDRQDAKIKRQQQRQAMKLAKQQAKQDRKLAQTEARQQDNIIKAQAKAGAIASGDTFGARIGDAVGNVGEGAKGLYSGFGSAIGDVGEGAKGLLSNNPNLLSKVGDFVSDTTGIEIDDYIPGIDPYDDFDDLDTKSKTDESFISKYKIPLLVGGGLVGVYFLTKGKKK